MKQSADNDVSLFYEIEHTCKRSTCSLDFGQCLTIHNSQVSNNRNHKIIYKFYPLPTLCA